MNLLGIHLVSGKGSSSRKKEDSNDDESDRDSDRKRKKRGRAKKRSVKTKREASDSDDSGERRRRRRKKKREHRRSRRDKSPDDSDEYRHKKRRKSRKEKTRRSSRLSDSDSETSEDSTSRHKRKSKADEIIPKTKKKRDEIDLETSWLPEMPKRSPTKKAVLVGLKPPRTMNMNSVDVKAQILRMKKHLMEQRGFPEDKIVAIIEDEEDTEPTAVNIHDQLYRLVECSRPGDILFIHLIAYGCADGLILTPDQKHIEDTYFRALIVRAVQLDCNLTFVSDCLIQPKTRCPCPKTPLPVQTLEERMKSVTEFMSMIVAYPELVSHAPVATGSYGFVACTNLFHVDNLRVQGEDETETTPTPLPSRVILFTPFPCDHDVPPCNVYNLSEVVFPPPTGYMQTSYGAFTNSILDVIEETPVTNLELAQKAMVKLGGETPPRLSCSHLNYARAPFVC